MEKLARPLYEIRNPVDLALNKAMDVSSLNQSNQIQAEQIVQDLDIISTECDFHKRYYMSFWQAFGLPKDLYTYQDSIKMNHYKDMNWFISANLVSYAIIEIGRIELVDIDIKALCLTFDEVVSLSCEFDFGEDYWLHIPAYAIDDINQES